MTWEKRKQFQLPLPSGIKRWVHRPGPSLALTVGRLQRTLKLTIDENMTLEQVGDEFLASMDDPKERATIELSVKVFLACLVNAPDEQPVVERVTKPNQLCWEDVPQADFWAVVGWYNSGCKDIPVETEEGETTVEAVETFPAEQSGRVEPGSNGQSIRENSIPVAPVM